MNAKNLLVALAVRGLVIDFDIDDQTFQFSGDQRFEGFWERLFHEDNHPTRRSLSADEAQVALNSADEFRLWTGPQKFETISREELEAKLAPFLPKQGGAKR